MKTFRHMPTLLWMSWLSLKRDRVALILTFALPIAVFTMFVFIFRSVMTGGGGMSQVEVALVDEDQSEASHRFAQALSRDDSLKVFMAASGQPDHPLTRSQAEQLVKDDKVAVGVVLPKGFGEHFLSFDFAEDGDSQGSAAVDLLYDKQRNPVAYQIVTGLLQRAAMVGAPDLMVESGIRQFDRWGGGLTEQQRALMDTWLPQLRGELQRRSAAATQPASQPGATTQPAPAVGDSGTSAAFQGLVRVHPVNVQQDGRSDWEAFISYQVAQIAVMFLLFSMAGAAGTLLEEQESGTLERMLSSNVGMGGLVLGKWIFGALVGVAQLAVMFLWAWYPFGLGLWTLHNLAGWAIMSCATAATAAGFGMLLATACRSRGQLAGLSTIVILIISALGGSMLPRYIMGPTLRQIGLVTFNAWSLDGYRKVFYDQAPLWQLWPQVSVLAGFALAFMLIARVLARRWEAQ